MNSAEDCSIRAPRKENRDWRTSSAARERPQDHHASAEAKESHERRVASRIPETIQPRTGNTPVSSATLRLPGQDPLRKLVGDARLTRHKLAGQFLYCAVDRAQQAHQLRAQRLLMATPGLVRPLPEADLMPEELRAAIVLFASLLDERQRRLFAGLEALKCGWGGDRRIARLLGIDPSTVAAGRRQLVERDVERDRVRRAGGGRPRTEKKRPKSSPTSKP